MNEPFPWVEVFSAFLWILGIAIILADFSYHEFLVHVRKLKWLDVIRSRGFLWPIKVAVVLILFGMAGSVPNAFWGGVFGAAGFLAAIFFLMEYEKAIRWLRRRTRRMFRR
jgi:hypothetical protein